MKFSCLPSDILPVLQSVARCVGVQTTLPVLGNILLRVKDGKLELRATNLEIGVIKFLKVEVEEEGEMTVPAKTILELLSSAPQIKISLEAKDNILSLEASKFHASINGISASEFPVIPTSDQTGVVFAKEELLQGAQILFAAASDEGRPTLTGVLTEISGGHLNLVATDGFRLAHRQIALQKPFKDNFKALIPRRTFEELLRVLSEEEVTEVEVVLSPNQNQVIFKLGQTMISSRLIEGKFPDWEKIIPQDAKTRALLLKEDLLKAVKLASVFAKNEANNINLYIENSKITIKSESKEVGFQQNEVEAEMQGEGLEISFNCKFLQEALSAAPSNQLMVEFSGPLQPALVKPVGIDGLEYIIMPVRLS